MSNKDILVPNPLESIADVVRKQFQQKGTASKKYDPSMSVVLPALPSDERMQSKRRVRTPEVKAIKAIAEVVDVPMPDDDEIDDMSPIMQAGSIYEPFADGTPGEEPLTPEEAALQIALAVRKGHEKGRPDIDWHMVKMLYVYGGWTYERIASECNISFSMVRLNGRKGRWVEAREAYRGEQARRIEEKIALEEDRLRDWQISKRRQAGIDGLNWVVKAISNLRDDASPDAIAKLAGILDRMLSSVTGLSPVDPALMSAYRQTHLRYLRFPTTRHRRNLLPFGSAKLEKQKKITQNDLRSPFEICISSAIVQVYMKI